MGRRPAGSARFRESLLSTLNKRSDDRLSRRYSGRAPVSANIRYCADGIAGPITSRYVGTQALFQLSSVAPQTEHSKLLICLLAAMDSVRL